MRVFYTPRYYADIGDGHIFPIRKFELVRDRLLGEGTLRLEDLIDRTADESYLQTLAHHLPLVLQHDPDILFYLGGADPYVGDKLGRLALSIEGLRTRDELVLDECYQRKIPAVTVMSGGYGENVSDTVEIHCNTIRTAKKMFESREEVFSRGVSGTERR